MGGLGSGHWYRYDAKPTVEGYRSLEVGWMVRQGIIKPGQWRRGRIKWSDPDTGEERSSITYTVDVGEDGRGSLRLEYTCMRGEPEQKDFDYRVPLVTTRPHLGGLRWWFLCPLVVNGRPCRRRVANLYCRGGYFGCRTCHGLVYRSTQEAHQDDRLDRMLLKMWFAHGGPPDPSTASDAELILMMRASLRER